MSSSTDSLVALPVRQINGCRYFGPREELKAYTPPRGSEVFVARIPQDFPHKELLKIFFNAGQVYDVRLMLTFMKENKGYAFVRYFSPEMALNAIKRINGHRLNSVGRQGHLVAMISTDHRTLMLSGCSPDVNKEEVEWVFQDMDSSDLISVTEEFQRGRTSPVFYLLFASHRGAALMKKGNWKDHIPRHWGAWVKLDWQPNDEVNQRHRFKLEKRNYLNFIESHSTAQQNTQASAQSLGFSRNVLTNSNMRNEPLMEPQLQKGPIPSVGHSDIFQLATTSNVQNNSHENCLMPSGKFLPNPRSAASTGTPPNNLPGSSSLRWSPGSAGAGAMELGNPEPLGAWGGAPLPSATLAEPAAIGIRTNPWLSEMGTVNRHDSEMGAESHLDSEMGAVNRHDSEMGAANHQDSKMGAASCYGSVMGAMNCIDSLFGPTSFGFSSSLFGNKENITDKNCEGDRQTDVMSFTLFGRPIRGRGNTDHSTRMRF